MHVLLVLFFWRILTHTVLPYLSNGSTLLTSDLLSTQSFHTILNFSYYLSIFRPCYLLLPTFFIKSHNFKCYIHIDNSKIHLRSLSSNIYISLYALVSKIQLLIFLFIVSFLFKEMLSTFTSKLQWKTC